MTIPQLTLQEFHPIIESLQRFSPNRSVIDILEDTLMYLISNDSNGIVFLKSITDRYQMDVIIKVLTDEIVFLKLQL
jgi:hypothetical protein